jgi:hypothetical protein
MRSLLGFSSGLVALRTQHDNEREDFLTARNAADNTLATGSRRRSATTR